MAIESDVLVIGGGLAGRMAAIAAADAGARTRLVTANQSTLRQASGLIDVLGYPPQSTARDGSGTDAGGPIVDPFAVLPGLPEGHPYERVGVETVRDALAAFDDVVDDYHGAHTDTNALVPTHGGVVKPTARYPEATAHGLASDDRDAVLVGFESLTDFDAPVASAHLEAAGVPFDVAGVTIRFPGDLRADAKATRYAELLEADEVPSKYEDGDAFHEGASGGSVLEGSSSGAVTGESRGASTARQRPVDSSRTAVVERIQDAIDGLDVDPERIGFPAVLGEERPATVRADLADRLGVPVFEVPAGPPSLPGIRLERQLRDALRERDVRIADGRPVVDFEAGGAGDAGVEHLVVESAGGSRVPMAADAYVLATGGLVGRGIDADRDRVREPIFDCHVPHPADRYEWFADDAFGDHPFAYFGVQVDRDLRPLDAAGDPEFANLHAAGAVLGGYDFAAENSGAGVSIATGYAAGRTAGRTAAEGS